MDADADALSAVSLIMCSAMRCACDAAPHVWRLSHGMGARRWEDMGSEMVGDGGEMGGGEMGGVGRCMGR